MGCVPLVCWGAARARRYRGTPSERSTAAGPTAPVLSRPGACELSLQPAAQGVRRSGRESREWPAQQ